MSASAQLLIAPEVSLPLTLPAQLPPPLFQLSQILKFGKVPAGDFGRVVGIVYAAGATVQATGYHYLLFLDEQSKSRRELGITGLKRKSTSNKGIIQAGQIFYVKV